jgi:hypothetical protein
MVCEVLTVMRFRYGILRKSLVVLTRLPSDRMVRFSHTFLDTLPFPLHWAKLEIVQNDRSLIVEENISRILRAPQLGSPRAMHPHGKCLYH